MKAMSIGAPSPCGDLLLEMTPESVPWSQMRGNSTLTGHLASPELNGIHRPIARAFFPLRGAAQRMLFLVVLLLSAHVHRRHTYPGWPANPARFGRPWGDRTAASLACKPASQTPLPACPGAKKTEVCSPVFLRTPGPARGLESTPDRKSTRLNSSHT